MLVEAGFVSLIRTLLIFAGIYYGFKLIFRFLVPFLLKRFIQKHGANYSQQSSNSNRKKDGEVNINSRPNSKSEKEKLGDYVDFEEIKEND